MGGGALPMKFFFFFFKGGKHTLNSGKTEEGSVREGPKKQITPFTFLNKAKLSEPSVLVYQSFLVYH